jgi:phosphatidate cytidylyltransferase
MGSAVLALVIFANRLYFPVFLGLLGTLSLREYFHLTKKMDLPGQPLVGYAGFLILLIGWLWRNIPLEGFLAGILILCFGAALARQGPMRERVTEMMVNVFGILYIGLCLYPALPLRYDFGEKLGLQWILILLSVIWVGDSAAFFIGKAFGRTQFSPEISPRKTNEGAIAGLAAGAAAAAALQHFFFNELPLRQVVFGALILGMAGQLGDLAESLLKRAAGSKDSSGLIPGHGGILDRIDSLLFAIPVLYVYLLWLYPKK